MSHLAALRIPLGRIMQKCDRVRAASCCCAACASTYVRGQAHNKKSRPFWRTSASHRQRIASVKHDYGIPWSKRLVAANASRGQGAQTLQCLTKWYRTWRYRLAAVVSPVVSHVSDKQAAKNEYSVRSELHVSPLATKQTAVPSLGDERFMTFPRAYASPSTLLTAKTRQGHGFRFSYPNIFRTKSIRVLQVKTTRQRARATK